MATQLCEFQIGTLPVETFEPLVPETDVKVRAAVAVVRVEAPAPDVPTCCASRCRLDGWLQTRLVYLCSVVSLQLGVLLPGGIAWAQSVCCAAVLTQLPRRCTLLLRMASTQPHAPACYTDVATWSCIPATDRALLPCRASAAVRSGAACCVLSCRVQHCGASSRCKDLAGARSRLVHCLQQACSAW